jgi:hypothetical protein
MSHHTNSSLESAPTAEGDAVGEHQNAITNRYVQMGVIYFCSIENNFLVFIHMNVFKKSLISFKKKSQLNQKLRLYVVQVLVV